MLNEQALRKIGFTDPNVINYILNNPEQRSRYEGELGLVPTTSGGQFNFDYPNELQKAFNDLGTYYDQLLKDSNGDLNTAISRLTEDYDTGNRFKNQRNDISRETLQLAQEELSQNADTARRTLENSLVGRGLFRTSNFSGDPNMGVATTAQNELGESIDRSQERQNLNSKNLELGITQDQSTADTAFTRGKEDLNLNSERYKRDIAEERKQRAEQLASSRQARAYSRFESSLF